MLPTVRKAPIKPRNYDAVVLERHVDQLYQQANGMVKRFVAFYAIGGGGLAFATCKLGETFNEDGLVLKKWAFVLLIALGTIAAGAFGWFMGNKRSNYLLFQAQATLCQMEIVKHLQRISNSER